MPAMEPCGGGNMSLCNVPTGAPPLPPHLAQPRPASRRPLTHARRAPAHSRVHGARSRPEDRRQGGLRRRPQPGAALTAAQAGLGKTFGLATEELLSPPKGSGAADAMARTLPNDFVEEPATSVGMYTRLGVKREEPYKSVTAMALEKEGYGRAERNHIAGYKGFIPGMRDRIAGPGEQYSRSDAPGVNSQALDSKRDGMARTELRDATRGYDEAFVEYPDGVEAPPKKPIEGAVDHTFQNDAAALINQAVSPVSLGIGPKTADSPWDNRNPYNQGSKLPGQSSRVGAE